MAKYWVYVNDAVAGPYNVEQLIRLKGFSRQTQICVDEGGAPGAWISPAKIPELSHIFEAVDQMKDSPAAPPKAAPRPAPPRPPVRRAPEPPKAAPPRSLLWLWILLTLAALGGGAVGVKFYLANTRTEMSHSKQAAIDLIQDHPLPTTSLYPSLRHYMNDKQLTPRWTLESTPAGLWNVTLSWSGNAPPSSTVSSVYAFEANTQAQSARGLNTAAVKLLSEGFPRPTPPPAPASASAKPKETMPSFDDAIGKYSDAVQKADFGALWNTFSDHKRGEMSKAGISQEGFVRLQTLTHKLEQGFDQSVLKTKADGEGRKLVLLKQTRENRPNVFIKQTWVLEDHAWKLDEEEKKTADASNAAPPESPAVASPAATPVSSPTGNNTPPAGENVPAKKAILSLPGISN